MKTNRICQKCGNAVAEKYKHTCAECRAAMPPRTCKVCGVEIEKGKQLCDTCRSNRGHIKKGCEMCGVDIPATKHYCAECKQMVVSERRRKKYEREKESGKRNEWAKRYTEVRRTKKKKYKPCKECGVEIPVYEHASWYCPSCREKKDEKIRIKNIEGTRRRRGSKEVNPDRVCKVCGCDISYRPRRSIYCLVCQKSQKNNNGKIFRKIAKAARRNRKAGLVHDLTAQQWRETLVSFGNKCVYCGKEADRLEKDHFISLVAGGGFTKTNIVPACKSCNSRKFEKHPLDWLVEKEHGLVTFVKIQSVLASFIT